MRTPVGLVLGVISTAVATLQEREASHPEQPRAAVQAAPEPAAPLTRQQRRLQEQRARRNRG